MGGTVCLMAAAAAPEKVKRLVLLDPAIMPRAWEGHTEVRNDAPLVLGALRRRSVFPDRAAAIAALGRVDEVGFPNQVIADSRLLFEESGVGSQADVG